MKKHLKTLGIFLVRTICVIILIPSLVLFPFLGIGLAFGLAGSTSGYIAMIAVGCICLIASSFVCIFRYTFFPTVIASILLIIAGIFLNDSFWDAENYRICEERRSDPACVETECDFICTDANGNKITKSFIPCKDKRDRCLKKAAEESKHTATIKM